MSKTPRMDSAFKQLTSTTPRMNWQLDQCYREGCKVERELATVAEQRDRLAEAASKLTHYIKKARAGDSPNIHYFIISSIDDAILKMDKALAAVKGGSDE